MFHYRKNFKRYLSLPKADSCTFCEDDLDGRSIEQTKAFYIVPNRVKYDVWEVREVIDHLLVIPRLHVESFSHLDQASRLEFMDICAEYEQRGYHVYARGKHASSRSVHHQHTHLIKTKDRRARLQIAVTKPHILIKL